MKITKKSITAASDNQTVRGTVMIYPDFADYRDSVTTSMLKNQVSAVAPAVKFTCKKTGDQVAVTISGTADDVKKAQLAVESCDVSKKVSWDTKDVSAACGKKRRSIKSSTSEGRSVTAAEGDYIKIGNRILPKNAIDDGYADFDTVSDRARRAYDKEKADERKAAEDAKKAAEQAEREAKGKELADTFAKLYQTYAETDDLDELMSDAFEEFVPAEGQTDNLAAELIRAIERLRYRSYNDGDKFYSGYGLESCAPSAAFIKENSNDRIDGMIEEISYHDASWPDDQYDLALNDLAREIVEYIYDNPDLFGQATKDSRDYDSYLIEEWKEASHNLEFEPDVSSEYLERLMDKGDVDWDDVYSFLEDLTRAYGGYVNQWARDGFTITDLDEQEYAEWEDYYYNEFESWVDSLVEEYGLDEEEDEDEWDEDEDEEDEE